MPSIYILLIIFIGTLILGYALLCWSDKFNPFKNWKAKKKLADETERAIAHHDPDTDFKKQWRIF